MDDATDLGKRMLTLVQEVERAVAASGTPDMWPPRPHFSLELLAALAGDTFDNGAVIERLVAHACDD
jgi:hypothetical protein